MKSKIRKVWDIDPNTRIVKSKKKYKRQEFKREFKEALDEYKEKKDEM